MTTTTLIRRATPGPKSLCLCLGLLLCASRSWPETIRVAAWNLDLPPISDVPPTNGASFLEGVAALRKLNPTVVLLSGVRDPGMCEQLVGALKPATYKVAICSAFGAGQAAPATNVAELEELKRSYNSRIAKAQAELVATQNALAERQAALGNFGKELLAQGAMDWPDVPTEKVGRYIEVARELDKLSAQEHELLRRGYKDAHRLVQTVRTLLRNYSTQRAELERAYPTLKYLAVSGDIGTNATAQDIVGQLAEIRKLSAQVAASGNALSNIEFEASRVLSVESRIPGAEQPPNEHPKADALRGQVAILTKREVYSSGAEAWAPEGATASCGGFSFAVLQVGGQRMGCFSALYEGQGPSAGSSTQLLGKIRSLRNAEDTPAVEVLAAAIFIRGSIALPTAGDATRVLEEAGFVDAMHHLAPDYRSGLEAKAGRGSADHLFIESTVLPFNPQLACGSSSEHCVMVCDVELDTTKVAAVQQARSQLQEVVRPSEALAVKALRPRNRTALGGSLAVLVCLLGLWGWKKRRRRERFSLLPLGVGDGFGAPAAYTVVLAPKSLTTAGPDQPAGSRSRHPVIHVETPITTQTQSASWQRRALAAEQAAERANALLRQGLVPHLSRWLKEKLVRKLINDRAELLATQQAAVRQVIAVDERLARIEAQIQHQNRAYVRRIEELTAELQAAKEENRALIRARIAQVKSEMETARARLLKAESKDGPQG